MTEVTVNNRGIRSWVYGMITLCSLVVFGNIAEVCDIGFSCPVRLRVIISLGVLATIFSIVIFVALLCGIEPIIQLEILFVVILFVLYSICVGIVSSVRTGLGNIIAISFSWIALALVCLVMIMVLTSNDSPCPLGGTPKTPREKIKDMEQGLQDVETPEEEYMEKVGTPKSSSGPDSDQSPGGIVEDSKEMNDKDSGNA